MLLYGWLHDVVRQKGGARALVYRDSYLSWRSLLHRVDRRAGELESSGIRAGDWVGLMLGNVPDAVILSLALGKLGATTLPLDPTTSNRDLETMMAATPVRALVTRPRGGDAPLPAGPAVGPNGRPVVPESRRRLQGTLLSCAVYGMDAPVVDPGAEAVTVVLITSDAAGDPKLVERTAANLTAEADNVAAALGVTGEDRALLSLPIYHSFGFDLGLLLALRTGATIHLEDEVGALRVLKQVREQQITLLPATTQLLDDMARLPAARPLSHSPARFVAAGTGLSAVTADTFRKKYGVSPIPCYHTTETGTVAVDPEGTPDCVGRVLEGVEVSILNPKTDRQAATSRKGQLWVRSAAVSPLCASALPPAAQGGVGTRNAEGWYRTGYVASLDRTGRLRLQGREDDTVVLEGKRVALGEVEGCIQAFPAVRTARARLITDPLGGPMVVARVVMHGDSDVAPEAIIDFCARNLSPHKVPRRIELCDVL